MKKINPLSLWMAGKIKSAVYISCHLINDNLSDQAGFYYALFAQNEDPEQDAGEKLIDGNLVLNGENYKNWDGSNKAAFDWISTELNINFA